MSGAISAIVGVVEIALGAVLADTPLAALSEPLISAGVATLLGYAVSLLVDPRKAPLIPIGASYSGTLEQPLVIPESLEDLVVVYLRD